MHIARRIRAFPETIEAAIEPGLLERDLKLARQIQESLLPKAFPSLPGFQVSAFCRSAHQVGGDFFDVVPLASGSTLFVISDAMGKGIAAAMLAASLRSLIRTLAQFSGSPGDLLARVNRLMFQDLSSVDMFITVQLAVLDAARRQLTVASAGHCPLLLVNGGSAAELISPEGMPLGIKAEAVFVETMVSLGPTAAAMFYTDGLTEARSLEGNSFGQRRLEAWLQRGVAARLSAPRLKEQLLRELTFFENDGTASDDQTFVLLVSATEPVESCDAASLEGGSILPLTAALACPPANALSPEKGGAQPPGPLPIRAPGKEALPAVPTPPAPRADPLVA